MQIYAASGSTKITQIMEAGLQMDKIVYLPCFHIKLLQKSTFIPNEKFLCSNSPNNSVSDDSSSTTVEHCLV
jgi:hypothetical protein